MQTTKTLLVIIIILCISVSLSSAQENAWKLICFSGDTISVCKLDSLPDMVLFATCICRTISIPIDSIAVLTRFKEGSFWNGAGKGFLFGAAIGAFIGFESYHKPEPKPFAIDLGPGPVALGGGILGGTGGFLIGGIIGTSSGHYEIYDLRSEKILSVKQKILLKAFDD